SSVATHNPQFPSASRLRLGLKSILLRENFHWNCLYIWSMADEDATSSNILPQLNDAPESASTVAPSATASESIAASASAPAIRPSLVPLGGSSSQTAATPPTKKFSSVNINKKFLEKNSSSSSASGASHT
ncbi:unnamed protein product, partial [Mycena citricolor]